ncbi:MAG: hypothetical protein Kow002_12170 [Anaerolineales bacterium]
MAKVSLRSYNQEIETMIENGQLEEAIAHCRHILNAFPKNLETYRLLGKAYLEARRYEEALNIFQRVVMAVPDDFVSHVGMSIINDEQNKLDAAIWHMERAFESQPSNAAIQAELQRLYGRRDGMEPAKIRLTRGALAHMYVQGELYPQAISEITSVLEEDPARQDMQVLLARAYFHSGQKSEAAEICARLLQRYPYNLDANRILVELLPESERAESTQVYRQRINELDPYTAFATGSVFRASEVPDAAVNLERLEWDGQSVELDSGWDSSLGIRLGEEEPSKAADDEQPDWLKASLSDDDLPASSPTEKPAPVSSGESQIPDFLREAGWTEGSGAFDESQTSFESASDLDTEPELEQGSLPEWLAEMRPEGVETKASAQDSNATEDDSLPDWMQELSAEGDALDATDSEVELETGDLPDWLDEMKADAPAAAEADELPSQQPVEPAEESTADHVASANLDDLGASASEQDDAVAWLEGLATKHGAKPEELVTDPEARTETEPEWVQQAKQVGESIQRTQGKTDHAGTELPATSDAIEPLLAEESLSVEMPPVEAPVAEEKAEEDGTPANVDTLGVSASEQDDAVAWLESLAAKHGAKPEELVTDPDARKETAPEWVQQASQAAASTASEGQEPASAELESAAVENEEGEPDWKQRAREVGESLYDELEDAQSKEPVPSAETDETGVWLQGLGNGGFGDAATHEDGFDEWSVDPLLEGEDVKPESDAEAPDWLLEMEDGVSAPEDPLAAEAGASSGPDVEFPDWLMDVETESSETESFPVPTSEEEIPPQPDSGTVDDLESAAGIGPSTIDDFDDLRAQVVTVATGAEAEKPVDDLPGWLAGLDDEKAESPPVDEFSVQKSEDKAIVDEPLPTKPDEWQPVTGEAPVQPNQEMLAQEKSVPEPKSDAQPESYREPITRSRSGMTGMLSTVSDPVLQKAQTELSRGDIPAALDEYSKLIKKGKFLEETIFDLREALYRYPVEVSIWQALGDAYMRDNRLQDALDAYTKAEELLR